MLRRLDESEKPTARCEIKERGIKNRLEGVSEV